MMKIIKLPFILFAKDGWRWNTMWQKNIFGIQFLNIAIKEGKERKKKKKMLKAT